VLRRSLAATALLTALSAPPGWQPAPFQRVDGGIVRGSTETRQLALVFTGHEFAEGATTILDELARRRVKASFFLTGTFLRDRNKGPLVVRMVREGHYVGPHSDAHLLYAPWTGPKVTLVSRETFTADVERNLDALRPFGVSRSDARFFLPSYEWYTEEIAAWARAAGLTLVCHTPGTRSNADYTEEGTPQFVPSDAIVESILRREREDPHGLNGFLLLLHVGAGPGRTDKFHRRLGELVDALAGRGYTFARVDVLLQTRRN
jgi:peptidoglycan/xylan/chitin deacetylase (PgdA/CDA1 family)